MLKKKKGHVDLFLKEEMIFSDKCYSKVEEGHN